MSTLSAIAAASLAVTLPLGPGVQSAEPVAVPSARAAASDTVEVLAGWGKFGGSGMETKWFTAWTCPCDRPYLSDREFHPASGYGIPRGVEIRASVALPTTPVFAATAGATLHVSEKGLSPSGILWATITNFDSLRQSVYIILHCTKTAS
ncbi:hypothetical protein [Agromyces aerolatus]|uniref:hypothetical protein n=1 Tax=Agromyces sp. LY-1074 TaxID=3074080 RepID=UPI002862FF6A|nr:MULTISPECIES: hypothetical protein [unclassified Agromyces]MDR5698313.1 hypothetical protein [Agromyces sp. LY-1074]MDR5704607.1 hypothetical protein [Agromyces sp. LY-1358]